MKSNLFDVFKLKISTWANDTRPLSLKTSTYISTHTIIIQLFCLISLEYGFWFIFSHFRLVFTSTLSLSLSLSLSILTTSGFIELKMSRFHKYSLVLIISLVSFFNVLSSFVVKLKSLNNKIQHKTEAMYFWSNEARLWLGSFTKHRILFLSNQIRKCIRMNSHLLIYISKYYFL